MPAPLHPSTTDPEATVLTSSDLVLNCLTALRYRSGDLEAYLSEVVSGISRLSQSDWTIVTLASGETGQIIASSRDIGPEYKTFSIHETLAGEVIQSGQPVLIENSRKSLRYRQLPQKYLSYLGVPLRTIGQDIVGTICSFFQKPRLFLKSELEIVELFADRAATTIENYRLYQQQQQFNQQLCQENAAYSIQLRQAQRALIERERLAAIGEFSAMIVHEVRNPLTTIQMGLNHAQNVLQSDADQQRLALAISESHRLQHLLDEVLSYARPQTLRLSRLDIGQFFRTLIEQVQALPEAADRDIRYIETCPQFDVMADVDKLKQVFLNLFRNACEATSPGEPIFCELSPGHRLSQVRIQIRNQGDPIPPELLPKLTEPFCSTKPGGTGLGLAISKQIIHAHGGTLGITSSDVGTTVSVYLAQAV